MPKQAEYCLGFQKNLGFSYLDVWSLGSHKSMYTVYRSIKLISKIYRYINKPPTVLCTLWITLEFHKTQHNISRTGRHYTLRRDTYRTLPALSRARNLLFGFYSSMLFCNSDQLCLATRNGSVNAVYYTVYCLGNLHSSMVGGQGRDMFQHGLRLYEIRT